MKFRITFYQVIFTLIVASSVIGFALYSGYKECERGMELLNQPIQKVTSKPVVEKLATTAADKKRSLEQWETVSMNVSAYCPCEKCCGIFADGITASGHQIVPEDVFVAAPKKYPFGTEMVIEGYAEGKAVKVEDVGGAIKGNKLDLFFDSHKTALLWGRKQVDVRVKVKVKP